MDCVLLLVIAVLLSLVALWVLILVSCGWDGFPGGLVRFGCLMFDLVFSGWCFILSFVAGFWLWVFWVWYASGFWGRVVRCDNFLVFL